MTHLAKRILLTGVGAVVVSAIIGMPFFWPREERESGRTGEHEKAGAENDVGGTGGAGTAVKTDRPVVASKEPEEMSAVLASVQTKMTQWSELRADDDEGQTRILAELTKLLSDENVADVIRSLTPEQLKSAPGNKVLERWLEAEPVRAALWIAARADASDEQAWLISRELLKSPDLLDVLGDQLPNSPWKEQLLSSAALQTTSSDPLNAIALAQRMEEGNARRNIFETVAYDWMHRDPEAALRWMMSVKDDMLRERLLATGAKAIAVSDPDLAAIWLGAAVKSEGIQRGAVLSVVEVWAAENPRRAADWVAQLQGSGREEAADIVFRNWARSDELAATAWILRLPKGAELLARWQAERRESQRQPEP